MIRLYFRSIIIAVVLILGFYGQVFSCSCGNRGPFLAGAKKSDIVLHGRVISYHEKSRGNYLSMEVEIKEVFKGIYKEKKIRVWGDNGMLCRPYVSTFPIGTEWMFALSGPNATVKRMSANEEYVISICGTYWLKVEDGQIIGNLEDRDDRVTSQIVSIDKFRNSISRINQWYYMPTLSGIVPESPVVVLGTIVEKKIDSDRVQGYDIGIIQIEKILKHDRVENPYVDRLIAPGEQIPVEFSVGYRGRYEIGTRAIWIIRYYNNTLWINDDEVFQSIEAEKSIEDILKKQ